MDDGTPFFTEDDITYTMGVSIARIPAGSILLYLKPTSTKSADYKGNPTPIRCYINSVGERVYRCLHVQVSANQDTVTKAVVCTKEWVTSSGVTSGTLKSHCRSTHWIQLAPKTNILHGKQDMAGFFASMSARKRVKLASGKIIKVPAPKTVLTVPTDTGNVMASPKTNVDEEFDLTELEVEVVEEPTKVAVLPEVEQRLACGGVLPFRDMVKVHSGYDFVRDYPLSIHS